MVPPPLPKEAVVPKEPTRLRTWIADITTEKAARLLGENIDGLVNFRDEVAGLFGSFDKYGGAGSDKSFWLEAYGGGPHRYDRVGLGKDSIDTPYCAVSLLGCIQPDRLNSMILSGDDDGLAARPLYVWPDAVRPRRPTERVDGGILLTVLRRLRSLAFDQDMDGNARARVKPLSSDAMFEFQAWWEHTQWDAKRAASGRIAGAIGKLDGFALRLAQVIELLEWAWSGSNHTEPEQIGLRSVEKALRLIDTWVRATLERVFAEASLPQAQRDAMTVGRWILKTRPTTVNARDLRRQAGFPGPKEAKELDEALEVLVAVDEEHTGYNPARDVPLIKTGSTGFHTWAVEEVERFEQRYPIGTKPRLALALMLWTGVRRSDAVLLGRQHVKDGWLKFTQQKNRNRAPVTIEIPVLPELQHVIDASPTGDLTFLVSEHRRPFSVEGFGRWFRACCDEAGLPQCTAHGLRKAGATIAAENGATVHQLMSIFGWATAKEAERYTKAARRKKMAGDAMPLLLRSKGEQKFPTSGNKNKR